MNPFTLSAQLTFSTLVQSKTPTVGMVSPSFKLGGPTSSMTNQDDPLQTSLQVKPIYKIPH